MTDGSEFHEKATLVEKVAVIGVLGILAGVFAMKGNIEASTGFASAIVTYATSRSGV